MPLHLIVSGLPSCSWVSSGTTRCSPPSNKSFDPTTLGGNLITGPAERWDLLVDFRGFAGKKVILYNDVPVPFTVPSCPRTGGHEYVWHCHILEHEDHDMMRPLLVR